MSMSKESQAWIVANKRYFDAKKAARNFEERAAVRLLEAEAEEKAAALYESSKTMPKEEAAAARFRAERCKEYAKAILSAKGVWYNEEFLQDEVWRKFESQKVRVPHVEKWAQ